MPSKDVENLLLTQFINPLLTAPGRGSSTVIDAFSYRKIQMTISMKMKKRSLYKTLNKSHLFDKNFYLANNPDVAAANVDPLTHFIEHGVYEFRNPHPDFDVRFYLLNNLDVLNARVNPLLHYELYGRGEGRAPNARASIDAGGRGGVVLDRNKGNATNPGRSPNEVIEFHRIFSRKDLFASGSAAVAGRTGLDPSITILIATNGCRPWAPVFIDMYRRMGLDPLYFCEPDISDGTLEFFKEAGVRYVLNAGPQKGQAERVLQYACSLVTTPWILRLDDDEFPSPALIAWANHAACDSSIYSWHIKRHELALIDNEIVAVLPKWAEQDVDGVKFYSQYERFFRKDDVIFVPPGPHSIGYVARTHGLAPDDAYCIHLDCIVRNVGQRLQKIRSHEKIAVGAGWNFVNHYIPEIKPRDQLNRMRFADPLFEPFVRRALETRAPFSGSLEMKLDELVHIQNDIDRVYAPKVTKDDARTRRSYIVPLRMPIALKGSSVLTHLLRNGFFVAPSNDVFLKTYYAIVQDSGSLSREFYLDEIVFDLETDSGAARQVTVPVNMRNSQFVAADRSLDVYLHGYELDVLSAIELLVEDDGVFVDIGANWGYFSIFTALRPKFRGAIHAIEANPHVCGEMKSIIDAIGLNDKITIHNFAVSNASGEIGLHTGSLSGLSSIVSHSNLIALNKTLTVQARRLSEIVSTKASMLKIDTEGAELLVLMGAADYLRSTSPAIILENIYSPGQNVWRDTMNFLSNLGYGFFVIDASALETRDGLKFLEVELVKVDVETRGEHSDHDNLLAIKPEHLKWLDNKWRFKFHRTKLDL